MRPMLTSLAVCFMQTDTQLPLIAATGLNLRTHSFFLPLFGAFVESLLGFSGSVLGLC